MDSKVKLRALWESKEKMLFSATDDIEEKQTLYFNKYENDFYQHATRESEWLKNARNLKLNLVSYLRDKSEGDSEKSMEKIIQVSKREKKNKKPNIYIEEDDSFNAIAMQMQQKQQES